MFGSFVSAIQKLERMCKSLVVTVGRLLVRTASVVGEVLVFL